MPDFSSYIDVGSQNFLIILAIIVGATALAFFILPILTKSKNFRVSAAISFKRIKENPVTSLVTIFLVVMILGGGYLFYLQGRPQIVSVGELNSTEGESLDYIQGEELDYFIIRNSDMYILDVRSEKDYTEEHVKGAFSVPIEEVRQGFSLPTDRKITVYSSEDNLGEAREAANIFQGQVKVKVYVVKGGFENLKSQGLETEEGPPFGGE